MDGVSGYRRNRSGRQAATETARRAGRAGMRMMRAVRVTVVLRVITGDVIGAIGHHRGMVMVVSRHASILMERGHPFSTNMRGLAFHGDGRERLNRKAHHEQHDEKEFAPVRHGYGV